MDYLITHGHFDDRHFPTEEDCEVTPAGIFTATCGQCKHFKVTRAHLDIPNEGHCKAKLQREWIGGDVHRYLHPKRGAFDPTCDQYNEVIPF